MTHPPPLQCWGCTVLHQPIPHSNYCTHAISEGVTTSSQTRSFPRLKAARLQNKPCEIWHLRRKWWEGPTANTFCIFKPIPMLILGLIAYEEGSQISPSNTPSLVWRCEPGPGGTEFKVAQISPAAAHDCLHLKSAPCRQSDPMLSYLKSIHCGLLCHPQKQSQQRSLDIAGERRKVVLEMSFGSHTVRSLRPIYSSWIRLYSGQWGGSSEQHLQWGEEKKSSPWVVGVIWCKLTVEWCNAAQSITLNNK